MQDVNRELKKLVNALKAAQNQFHSAVKTGSLMDDVRKYAERQGREAKKLFSSDVAKVKAFIEKEKKELEKIQKQLPGEVVKLRKFVVGQRKEFEKLLLSIRDGNALHTVKGAARSASKVARSKVKKTTRKSSSAKKPTTSSS